MPTYQQVLTTILAPHDILTAKELNPADNLPQVHCENNTEYTRPGNQ